MHRQFTTINHPGSNSNAWQINLSIPNEVHLILTQALPVELLRFEGENTKNSVLLHWQTASEQNTESFSVAHSTDGIHFNVIGKVPGKGTSTLLQSYRFLHGIPVEGVHYYRLGITDFDGSVSFSNIISVEQPREAGRVHISPNPTRGKITVLLDFQAEETTVLMVTDVTGRVVQQQQFSGMSKEIDLTGYAPGVYTLMLTNGHIIENQRVVLQY